MRSAGRCALNILRAAGKLIPFKRYLGRQLVALDQLANALINGFPDETMSSRFGRRKKNGDPAAKVMCDVLDVFEKDHCEKSIEDEAKHLGRVITEIPRGGSLSEVAKP